MATKKVTTATTKDVTAKVTAPETKTSEKAETTKKAETVKAVAATEPKKIEKETEKKVAAPKAEPVNSIVKEEKAKPEEKKAEKKAEEKKTEPKAAEKKTAEKKVTAKKAEEKAPAKKTTAKKTTTKKTTAKKSTAKKEIKVSAFVEYYGKQVEEKEIIARVKKAWTSSGNKIGDIKTMDLYIKPEESAVYYVINGTSTGAVAF